MWSAYSARDASEFVGLSESTIRSCVRDGLLGGDDDRVPLRLSFQDIKILKLVRSLAACGVSVRRARRQLRQLADRLGSSDSLSALSIDAHNGHVVVREGCRAWRADTGQMVFDFEFEELAGELREMPAPQEAEGPHPIDSPTADDWFDSALSLEESDPGAAMEAYERVLHLRPECTETLINLGRLRAEVGDVDGAAVCFRRALEIDPRDATALYNLGVVAQDIGRDQEAVALYRQALAFDHLLAEAHYNLATIFDRIGDGKAAIRHINEYRKLTRRRDR